MIVHPPFNLPTELAPMRLSKHVIIPNCAVQKKRHPVRHRLHRLGTDDWAPHDAGSIGRKSAVVNWWIGNIFRLGYPRWEQCRPGGACYFCRRSSPGILIRNLEGYGVFVCGDYLTGSPVHDNPGSLDIHPGSFNFRQLVLRWFELPGYHTRGLQHFMALNCDKRRHNNARQDDDDSNYVVESFYFLFGEATK